MSRVVRQSKYRHVFGTQAKRENSYDNVKPSKSAWDSNKVIGNNTYIGLIWEARGGGSFAIIANEKTGKATADIPLINGHKGDVLDISFSPFNDSIVASVSEDGNGRIWAIPDGGLKGHLSTPVQNLIGHRRKVGTIDFHPLANNVAATTSADYAVKLWDIEAGSANLTVSGHSEIIQDFTWDFDGKLFATASKDKTVRVFDPRTGAQLSNITPHQGIKGSRCEYLGDKNYLLTIGFSKTSDRQFSIYDARDLTKKLSNQNVDTASGILMPFYDNDTSVLFLAGKGDGNIRYYELVEDKPHIHFLSEFKSSTPQLGMGMRPKTAVNVSECEIANILKISQTCVEPISFTVPRKSELFQDDIYPPTPGQTPALTTAEWFAGKDGKRILVSLEGGFKAPEKPKFEVKEVVAVEEGPKSIPEYAKALEEAQKRIAYLEAELVKKDAKIVELSG